MKELSGGGKGDDQSDHSVCHTVLDGVGQEGGEYVEVREVARAQGIPECYCQKVLYALAKGGIVSSWKGRGFSLERPVSSINVVEVMEAVRGSGRSAKVDGSALEQELNMRIHDLIKGLFLGDLMIEGA